jgi:hypothetical protein
VKRFPGRHYYRADERSVPDELALAARRNARNSAIDNRSVGVDGRPNRHGFVQPSTAQDLGVLRHWHAIDPEVRQGQFIGRKALRLIVDPKVSMTYRHCAELVSPDGWRIALSHGTSGKDWMAETQGKASTARLQVFEHTGKVGSSKSVHAALGAPGTRRQETLQGLRQ